MPYSRPGFAEYVTNESGGTLEQNAPFTDGNFVGVAIKQKAGHWQDGLTTQTVIAEGEEFLLLTKGVVEVTTVAGLEVGDAVYITSENKLTKTESGNTKFGQVTEVAGERGTPSGMVRIDLDKKDSF